MKRRLDQRVTFGQSAFILFPLLLLLIEIVQKPWIEVSEMITDLGILIPYILVCCSESLHPIKLNKIDYLCPMDAKERIQRMKQAYYWRVILHVALFALGIAIAWFFGNFNCIIGISVCIQGMMQSLLVPPVEYKRKADYATTLLQVVILLSIIGELVISADSDDIRNVWQVRENVIVQGLLWIVLILLEIPLFLIQCREIKKRIRTVAFYEEVGQ